MARHKDSPELKGIKQGCTLRFIQAVEQNTANQKLLPKDIEKILGLGREVKNGLIWNSYKRGDRSLPPERLDKLIELAISKGLLPEKAGRELQRKNERKLTFASLQEGPADGDQLGEADDLQLRFSALSADVGSCLDTARWLSEHGSRFAEIGDADFVEHEILKRLQPILEFMRQVQAKRTGRTEEVDALLRKLKPFTKKK